MRAQFLRLVEAGRELDGPYASKPCDRNGRFQLAMPPAKRKLVILASCGSDWNGLPLPVWEHVSVSAQGRCPLWEEMCWVKDLFWEPEELVVQFHPPRSQYVNNHPFVLHLWKPVGLDIALPPMQCV